MSSGWEKARWRGCPLVDSLLLLSPFSPLISLDKHLDTVREGTSITSWLPCLPLNWSQSESGLQEKSILSKSILHQQNIIHSDTYIPSTQLPLHPQKDTHIHTHNHALLVLLRHDTGAGGLLGPLPLMGVACHHHPQALPFPHPHTQCCCCLRLYKSPLPSLCGLSCLVFERPACHRRRQ